MDAAGVRLVRTRDRAADVAAFAASLGTVVGLDGVLADLNRSGRAVAVPGRAAGWGFRWSDHDVRSQRWWPQGITVPEPDLAGDRDVLCTSWYCRADGGTNSGSRVTFVDLVDGAGPRYRHVLLVEPSLGVDHDLDVRPVRIHAGGLAWHGPFLHVAATARGLVVFRPADVVRVSSPERTWGYRYVLPVRFTYDGVADPGVEPMRYSFLSVQVVNGRPVVHAGEYGRGGRTTRMVDYELDPATSLLRETAGAVRPRCLHPSGPEGMQGVAVVDDAFYVTTSAGRWGRGDLHVGRPGSFSRFARVLPVGVEDLSFWRSRDQLWSLTEYPGRRFVFGMDRARFH